MGPRFAAAVICIPLCACIEAASPPPGPRAKAEPTPAAEAAAPRAAPEFVPADAGTAEAVITSAMELAAKEKRRVVVYVGASWCEPCQYFHRAVEAGELDAKLLGIRFVEFDSDRDGERLEAAGYGGQLIPRFALPGPDGRFGGKKIEGGVKGDGAVDHIMNRLTPLLRGSS